MANKISPIVDSIKNYVDQEANKDKLIAKSILGSKTVELLTLQTGVKGPTTINLLNTDAVFGDGSSCGFNPESSTEITQRQIKPAVIRVNWEVCDRNLLQTFAQYQVKLEAGLAEMPFEEYLLSSFTDSIKDKLDDFVWNGGTIGSESYDGLVKILTDASAPTAAYDKANPVKSLRTIIETNAELAFYDDTVCFLPIAVYHEVVNALIDSNYFHYETNLGGGAGVAGEFIFPGTNVRVICSKNAKSIVVARLSNLFYGTDLEHSEEEFSVVYDEVRETFLVKVLFSAGVQVAFPDQCVVGTVA